VRAERFVVVAIALAAAPIAWAHHSGSIFNPDSVVAVQGEVSRFSWTNPHVYIYVDDDGSQRRCGRVGNRDGCDPDTDAQWLVLANA
jgi:hypothetical protein